MCPSIVSYHDITNEVSVTILQAYTSLLRRNREGE